MRNACPEWHSCSIELEAGNFLFERQLVTLRTRVTQISIVYIEEQIIATVIESITYMTISDPTRELQGIVV